MSDLPVSSTVGQVVRVERHRKPFGAMQHYFDVLEGVVREDVVDQAGRRWMAFEEDAEGANRWQVEGDGLETTVVVIGHKNGTVAFIDVHDHIGGKYVGGPTRDPVVRDVVALRSGDRWMPVNQRALDPMRVGESLVPDEYVSNVRPIGAMP